MLPAPLAVSRTLMTSTPSVAVSRSSEESGTGSNQRLIPSPQDPYAESSESPSGQRLLSPTSPYSPSRQPPSPQPPIGDSQNPFRSQTTSPTNYEETSAFSPEHDGAGRGVRLKDGGPGPGEGVRRVSRHTGRRPTSQTPSQNRYSRNSIPFTLPPGAAPPQPNYGGNQ
jgi:chitin synthase